jgi:hypothetical protein
MPECRTNRSLSGRVPAVYFPILFRGPTSATPYSTALPAFRLRARHAARGGLLLITGMC